MSVKPSLAVGSVLLLAATFVAYFPALSAGFVWDDDYYVTNNPTLRDAEGLARIWTDPSANPQFYPLTFTVFWLEYHAWGLDPRGYHAVGALLHALAGILLWRVLDRIGIPGAFLAAGLFTLHPVNAESVAWISELKNTLSAVFYLGAALAMLPRLGIGRKVPTRRFPWSGLLLYFAALASKTVTLTLPLALALVIWWKRGEARRGEARLLAVMLAVGTALGTVTALLERHQIGAVGEDWSLGVVERFLLAGRVVWFYLGKLALPAELTFIYPRWEVRGSDPEAWMWLLAAAAMTAVLWTLRGRWGKGPMVAWSFFVLTLGPALGFVNVYPMRYSYVADHFQYLASVGPLALLASAVGAVSKLAERGRPVARKMIVVAVVALLVVYVTATWRASARFRSAEALWRDTLAKNPKAWMAHNNLGILLASEGRDDEAEKQFREALELRPLHAPALNNLGYLLLRGGRHAEAVALLEQAVARDPDDLNSRLHLADAFRALGKLDEAVRELREAAARRPADPGLRARLGEALAQIGETEAAVVEFESAARLSPNDADVQYNLGTLLARSGRLRESIPRFEAALRLRPGFSQARENLEMARRLLSDPSRNPSR
jgi:Flp pilus assembly protein TadD